MCYKKPGPRCSYHAKKQLQTANAMLKATGFKHGMEEYAKAKEEVEAAQLDYDSTPAGMAEMKLKIERKEDRQGTIAARLDYCKANREAMLAKVKQKDQGDIYNHGVITTTALGIDDFDTGIRYGLKEREDGQAIVDSYNLHSDKFAASLNEEEYAAAYWYTSDGFSAINNHIHKENGTHHEEALVTHKYPKKKIKDSIAALDTAFAKNKLDKPVVVYRGISLANFPKNTDKEYSTGEYQTGYAKYAENIYQEGSIHTFNNYQSTSIDANKARSFAQTGIVMEIKAKSVVALGTISSWQSEKEMLINRNTKFKVVSFQRDVPYDSRKDWGNDDVQKVTVIQLEEID